MQTSTSGGCSETEANEATVNPYGVPSCSVVTTVTPLEKCDMASLKRASSIGIAGGSYFKLLTSRRVRRDMRRHTITLALAAALFMTTAAFAADDIIRKGFNVAEGGTLRLDADLGDITIVTGGTGVAVEVIRDADGRRG